MFNKLRVLMLIAFSLMASCLFSVQAADLTKLVEVQNPVIFQLANGANATGSKMTIYNHSDKDLIIDGFRTDAFKMTMLHDTKYESGKRVMFPVDHIRIPAHKKLALTPNTHHFMFMGPLHKIETGEFITLKVHTNQGEFDVLAQVVPRRLK